MVVRYVKPIEVPAIPQTPAEKVNSSPERKKKFSAFKRIFDLGEKRVEIINNMMATGQSPNEVAKHIQQTWKEVLDIGENSLAQALSRFKRSNVASELVLVQEDHPLDSPKTKLFIEKVNVLEKMEELITIQSERIDLAHKAELTSNMPLKITGEEVSRTAVLLEKIQKLRFDLGIDKYQGPMLQAGKVTKSTTYNPDGSVVESQSLEASQRAINILAQYGYGEALEHDDS